MKTNFTRSALKKIAVAFAKDEDGATAIEYGLFAALVGAVIVGSVSLLGKETNTSFTNVKDAMVEANTASGS